MPNLLPYHRLTRAPMALALTALVTACGGGGEYINRSISSTSSTIQQGVFLDSAVSGLQYSSTSTSGITDSAGTFDYVEGETIRFFIGDIVIGSAKGSEVVTPLTLAGDGSSVTDAYVVNILRFLQTLDNDGNLNNGIQITQTMREQAAGLSLIFNTSTSSFEQSPDLIAALDELTSVTSAGSRLIVSSTDAVDHFTTTLADRDIPVSGNLMSLSGEEISEAQALSLFTSGLTSGSVWRFFTEIDQTVQASFGDITQTANTTGRTTKVAAFRPEGSDTEADFCTLASFELADLSGGDTVDTEDDANGCAEGDVEQTTYFHNSDSNLGVEVSCNGAVAFRTSIIKLSDTRVFSQGSLSFTSDQFDDLTNTTMVCGSLSDSEPDSNLTPDATTKNWSFHLVAPYQGDDKIRLDFTLNGDSRVGTYTISDSDQDTDASALIASAFLSSPVFGGSATDPIHLFAHSGSVTISRVTNFTVSGSFDLVTTNGDHLQGSFNLDLSN